MGRSDAELLEATRRGERDAFGALIERYQGVVSAVTYSRTGDRALSEDVAQETFIAAWRQIGQLREPSRLRSWLCAIARNLARKARRRTAREAPLDHLLVFEGANPFDRAAEAESERVVRDALLRVPDIYRDALVLYYRDQRSARDVAAALGISEAAALQRLARGRQYLADGVTDLVETSLRGARSSRNLAAIVLAALPAFAPSRAEAAIQPHGVTTMFKLTIAAAIAAFTTTGYAVHHALTRSTPAPVAVAAPAPAATPAAAPAPAAIPHAEHAKGPPPSLAAPPQGALPPGAVRAPKPDDLPLLDRAQIERAGVYHGPSRGAEDAPVQIAVYTDMTCHFCGMVLGSLDQLTDEYAGKLRVVFKPFSVRERSVLPTEAVLAAEAQGKFFELHDLVMAHQDDLSRKALSELAARAGLDVAAFDAAIDSHKYAAQVTADRDAAKGIEVQATPTLVINGKRVVGNLPIATLRAQIDEALSAR
jgi:RNA polymerase sigma factor (sigma-70 family)